MGAHLAEPFRVEIVVHVLHRIQAEAVDARKVHVPFAPSDQFLPHVAVVQIQIDAHEEVVIIQFLADMVREQLFLQQEHLRHTGTVIIVHSSDMILRPDEVGIFPLSAGEVEQRPGLDQLVLLEHMASVIRVELRDLHLLGCVAAHFVVQNDIRDDLDAPAVELADQGKILILAAVLGVHGSLLVEFTQIVQIIDTVAHIVHTAEALIGRRQPHIREAQLLKLGSQLLQTPPVHGIRRQVPFKALEHGFHFHIDPPHSFK